MMQTSPTTVHLIQWPLLAMALALAACGVLNPGVKYLATNGTGEKLQTKTTVGAEVPAACTTTTVSVPVGPNGFTVTYREPSTNVTGAPLTNLLLTSIYLSSPKGQTQVIRTWAKDPRGGGTVTIRNIVPPDPEVRVCVTATNIAGQESPPVSQPLPK
ncbi:MAG: hypothetical protein ABIR36_10145 [Nitrospiraceae bacterium]